MDGWQPATVVVGIIERKNGMIDSDGIVQRGQAVFYDKVCLT